MGVAMDHSPEAGCGRVEIKLAHIMKDIKPGFLELNCFERPECPGPGSDIDVSSNRNDGRYFSQGLKDLRLPNISGMDNQVRAFQGIDCLRPDQAMRI